MSNLLKGRAERVIEQLATNGRVASLTKEDTAKIDRGLGEAMIIIKKEFDKKERASRAYIADIESGRINFK